MHVQYLFDSETSWMSAAFAGVQGPCTFWQLGQVCPAERVEDMDVNKNCLQTQVRVAYRIHV